MRWTPTPLRTRRGVHGSTSSLPSYRPSTGVSSGRFVAYCAGMHACVHLHDGVVTLVPVRLTHLCVTCAGCVCGTRYSRTTKWCVPWPTTRPTFGSGTYWCCCCCCSRGHSAHPHVDTTLCHGCKPRVSAVARGGVARALVNAYLARSPLHTRTPPPVLMSRSRRARAQAARAENCFLSLDIAMFDLFTGAFGYGKDGLERARVHLRGTDREVGYRMRRAAPAHTQHNARRDTDALEPLMAHARCPSCVHEWTAR